MKEETVNVTIRAGGDNSTGDKIVHSNNLNTITSTLSIILSCYNTADGVCVADCMNTTACTRSDPDCTLPSSCTSTTTTTTTTGGSDSGGGGGGAGGSAVITRADYQIIRGEQNEIIVPYKNVKSNKTLTSITFKVTGKIAKYIEVVPSTMASLPGGETIDITLKITSPTYLPLGKEFLTLEIIGNYGSEVYREDKRIVIEINELSSEGASKLVADARKLLEEFKKEGFEYDKLDTLFGEIEQALDNLEYSVVKQKYGELETIVNAALESKEILSELEALLAQAKLKGIDTEATERLVKLARLALERKDFISALERAREAQTSYALEIKGEFVTLTAFVKNNPGEIALAVIFLTVFSFAGYKAGRYQHLKNKIRRLKEEDSILTELIKVVQRETFQQNKMSMEEYYESMQQYQKKIAAVIEQLIEAENQKEYALTLASKSKKLEIEKKRVISLIKDIQRGYLQDGVIETRIYELKLESYNRRLGEIDTELATMEAERAIKAKTGFFSRFRIPKEVLTGRAIRGGKK